MAETFRELRPSWIAFGWFIAFAVTALIVLAMVAIGLIDPEASGGGIFVPAAVLVGFLIGGFFAGARARAAPNLHGLGIGLFSLLAWGAINIFLGEPTGQTTWQEMPYRTAAALLLMQTAAAIVGARIGARWYTSPD